MGICYTATRYASLGSRHQPGDAGMVSRKRAGFSLEKATKKIGLSLSTLTKMEGGERKPTRRQLDKIAKSYWCPLTVFYASQPPLPTKCGVDFRSSELVTTTTAEEQGRLDALVRDVYARQSIVKDVLEDDEDEEPRSFVGSLKDTGDIDAAVEAVKKILNLPDDKILDFNELRERAHSIGCFVLLVGDLDRHSTRIDASARGFASCKSYCSFRDSVTITNADNSDPLWVRSCRTDACQIVQGSVKSRGDY